jgi:indolepyruvate ferredoxin oxidoreductase, beta subunit
MNPVTSVIIAGLGGQGVVKASDILADVAFRAGLDVKKAEIHGMSQRGGSVATDVRFGAKVHSPMTPAGQADFLIVVSEDQVDNNKPSLKPAGILLSPSLIDETALGNKKFLNIALLGAISTYLPFPTELWVSVLEEALPPASHEFNKKAFDLGRKIAHHSI